MRLLVLSDHYPPHLTGGYDIACEAVTEGLRRRGHAIRVLTSNYGVRHRESSSHVERVLHRPQDSASLMQLGWWELADHQALEKTLRAWRPDVVCTWKIHQLFPSLHRVLRAVACPVVFTLHDLWLPRHCDESAALADAWSRGGESGWVKQAVKRPLRATLRTANPFVTRQVRLEDITVEHAVFCSRFREGQHVAAGLGGRDRRVIYNGIHLGQFTPASRPATGGLKLLFVGRLVEEKGLHTVVESLAALGQRGTAGITLTVVGIPSYPHDYMDRIRALIGRTGLESRITMRPPVAADAMPSVYREHDALVFPSVGPEGFPMTVLEAAACGLAIVATTTGGTGEFVQHGVTGLTFAPGDAAALSECLETLSADRERVAALGAAARQLAASKFAIESIVDQWEEYLQGLQPVAVTQRIA